MLRLVFILMITIVLFPGSCLSVTLCLSATFLAQTPISFETGISDPVHSLA